MRKFYQNWVEAIEMWRAEVREAQLRKSRRDELIREQYINLYSNK